VYHERSRASPALFCSIQFHCLESYTIYGRQNMKHTISLLRLPRQLINVKWQVMIGIRFGQRPHWSMHIYIYI
jgi:hypothetical protein